MTGIRELCADNDVDPADIDYVFHGTTTATNAVLENKGARAGMITNEGFRDITHIGRHQRVEHYSIMQELPWQSRPLVQRRYRKTVGGRLIPPTGEELVPLDEDAVRRAAQELKAEGVESVAICFLFSYLNPAHEERAKAIVEEVMPDAFVTTSSFVSPQFREFERFTTASLAAFIGPKVDRYIDHLDSALRARRRVHGDLRIMASNGGVATTKMVTDKPALTLLSGLAAGVLGGAWIGDLVERQAADHLRHRRHQRRYRHHRRRRLRRDRCALHLDRRLPAADADDRHPYDRRGRRLDRPCRSRRRLPRRPAERQAPCRGRPPTAGAATSRP